MIQQLSHSSRGIRVVAAHLARQAHHQEAAAPAAHGSLLERLRAIAPDPGALYGDRFREAAQLIARQVVTDQPTPLDAASTAFPG